MTRRIIDRYNIFTGHTAGVVSKPINVSDLRNVCLQIVGSSTADGTVFVKGSIGQDPPGDRFSSGTQTRGSNGGWDYVEVVDLEDGTNIDGDTGVALSGNYVRLLEVNVNELDWVSFELSTITAGSVTATLAGATNQ